MPRKGNKNAKATQRKEESEASSSEPVILLSTGLNDAQLMEKVTLALAKGVANMQVSTSTAQSSEAGLPVGVEADKNQDGRTAESAPPKKSRLSLVGDNRIEDIEDYNLAKRVAMNMLPEFQEMMERRRLTSIPTFRTEESDDFFLPSPRQN